MFSGVRSACKGWNAVRVPPRARVFPWLPIFGVRDGVGHLARVIITRADTVSSERGKEIAHWLGLAKTVIGHSGWWVKIDNTTGVVTKNAGNPAEGLCSSSL
jgi:hypothetical protein